MALNQLTFTKDWTERNSSSSKFFPTVETDEVQVRYDMQLLHNEAKTAINGIITGLASTTDSDSGADHVGITTVGSRAAGTVQGLFEEMNTSLVGAERVSNMLEDIDNVVTTLGATDATIPTSKAVASAISQAGGGDMMKTFYDTTNTGNKVDTALNAEKLNGQLPAYYLKRNYLLQTNQTVTEWNVELRLGSIASLSFTCPTVPADIAAEIRGSFTAASGFTMAITPPAGMTIHEDDNNPTITAGVLYEFSLAVITSTYISLLIQEREV